MSGESLQATPHCQKRVVQNTVWVLKENNANSAIEKAIAANRLKISIQTKVLCSLSR